VSGTAPAGEAEDSTAVRSFAWWLIGLTALGLAVRILVVALASRNLPFDDGIWYLGQSHIIADGHGYLSPSQFLFHGRPLATAEHPPLYPALLSVLVWLGHGSVLALQMTSAVIGALGVAVIGLLGRRVGGARVGLVAAFLCAIAPNVWQYDAVLLSESILAVTLGLYLLALYRLWDRPSLGGAAFAGLMLALAGYNRAELLLLGVFAIPIVLRNPRLAGARPRVARLALVGLVAVAAVAPWTIRNLTTFQRPVYFTDNVDSVMAGANCRRTYNGREIGAWDSLCFAAVFRHGWDESVAFSEARHAGITYARRHPERLPVVVVARLGREFGLFKPFDGIGNDGRDAWLWIASAVSFWLMAVLGTVGAVMLRRAGRMMWPLASIAGFVTLLTIVTYGAPRLRAPLDIALLVLAAVPIERGLARLTGRNRRSGNGGVTPTGSDGREDQAGEPAVAPVGSVDAATRARSTASGAPLTTRYSVLRRCDTVPTRAPSGLWMPIWAPT
jgi:4-amino-4-deoxy-L-arabinose transferase-like glycosyltransferase